MDTKIVLYITVSLDGYIARENGDIDWLDASIRATLSATKKEK